MSTPAIQEYFHVELPRRVNVAIPLEQTAEVFSLEPRDICLMPGVSAALLGISNQRGRLLWMLDLLQLLGVQHDWGRSPHQRWTALVMRDTDRSSPRQLACVVSQLRGIIHVPPEKQQPVPQRLQRQVQQYLQGFVQFDRVPILLLNVEAIFASIARSPSSAL
ncbi:chemotaxis protein CheW [Thermosynechococcus sp. HN-54]|uniref:chemotaxis protein CheW n=1 Tax=Thermosynechococcus sp. HN-54 TaxID=2933959 RepID=UPI00202CB93B|nr:chemotaxis protein CheW [Thermosynechococcus sp. HN-54]URR36087.1 chemotaxis protein CheW [Thermosynechococcus sp. HN-54]